MIYERPICWSSLACLLGISAAVLAIAGCGETKVLDAKEAKLQLRKLPYRYEFRAVDVPKGADAAVAGQATGRHRTKVNFGIALGHGHMAVPVPGAGTGYAYGYPRGGFIFTSDILIKNSNGRRTYNPDIQTAAQQNEASEMTVSMTDKLCLAATGEHCPP